MGDHTGGDVLSVAHLRMFRTGFPHRGFPAALTTLVLKGNSSAQLTTRAGLALPPVDFEQNIATLSAKHGQVGIFVVLYMCLRRLIFISSGTVFCLGDHP